MCLPFPLGSFVYLGAVWEPAAFGNGVDHSGGAQEFGPLELGAQAPLGAKVHEKGVVTCDNAVP